MAMSSQVMRRHSLTEPVAQKQAGVQRTKRTAKAAAAAARAIAVVLCWIQKRDMSRL